MCGIFGFSVLNPNTRALAPILAFAMEARGDDSWGMTNGIDVVKYPNSICSNFWIPEEWEGQPAIFHTRAASVGTISEENAHPFQFTRQDNNDYIIGIHNGHINNHTELGKQYDRKFDVDSMHIFKHILDEQPLNDIKGWGAIAWFQRSKDLSRINLARFNMDALHVVKLSTGEFAFCSTIKPLTHGSGVVGLAVDKEYQVAGDRHYQLVLKDDFSSEFVERDKMVFGGRHAQHAGFQSCDSRSSKGYVPFSSSNSAYSPNTGETPSNYFERFRKLNRCAVCKDETIDRKKGLLCRACEIAAYDELIHGEEKYLYYIGNGHFNTMCFENVEVA